MTTSQLTTLRQQQAIECAEAVSIKLSISRQAIQYTGTERGQIARRGSAAIVTPDIHPGVISAIADTAEVARIIVRDDPTDAATQHASVDVRETTWSTLYSAAPIMRLPADSSR